MVSGDGTKRKVSWWVRFWLSVLLLTASFGISWFVMERFYSELSGWKFGVVFWLLFQFLIQWSDGILRVSPVRFRRSPFGRDVYRWGFGRYARRTHT